MIKRGRFSDASSVTSCVVALLSRRCDSRRDCFNGIVMLSLAFSHCTNPSLLLIPNDAPLLSSGTNCECLCHVFLLGNSSDAKIHNNPTMIKNAKSRIRLCFCCANGGLAQEVVDGFILDLEEDDAFCDFFVDCFGDDRFGDCGRLGNVVRLGDAAPTFFLY